VVVDVLAVAAQVSARDAPGMAAVSADVNYLIPGAERPWLYDSWDPPAGVPRSTVSFEAHRVSIHDARERAEPFTLDVEGMAFLRQPSAVRDFYDADEVQTVYYPEAAALIGPIAGAARVVVFDHTVRRRAPHAVAQPPGWPRGPVLEVHADYTVQSAPARLRSLLGEQAPGLLRHRFSIINVWRPIRGPLRDAPLAICDAGSMCSEQLVATDLVYPDRTGQIYYVTRDSAHRWYYLPDMSSEEVWLFKSYDSDETGRARFAAHTAFEDPCVRGDAIPRQSIELRAFAFYE
jgi:hypothetical protein